MAKDTSTTGAAPLARTSPGNAEVDTMNRRAPPVEDGKELGANHVDLNATRDDVQKRQDKLNEENEAGHAKNMEKIEHDHRHVEEARKDSDGGEDRIGGADPKLGREDNGNTPRIDKHGNKSWHPPGVAGARS
jgi:hypothetical protein